MSYLISIKTAIILFPFIAFIFTIPFILSQYHKYGAIHWFRILIIYTFILYLISIYFLVILPLPTFEEALKNTGPYYNFIPFNFVKDFLRETSLVITNPSTYLDALMDPCFYVVIFNIFMTIPFGMYLRYYFKCSFRKTVFYTFLLSLFFELTQGSSLYSIYPNPYRLCDIDDLILNTLGGALGYPIMGLFMKILPTRETIDEESLIKGQVVSGLRRLTIFFLDLFIYFILMGFISIFTKSSFLIAFIIYYIIIPIIFNNQTLGMKFLNVKMSFNKNNILKIIFRNTFIFLYYFFLPFWFLIGIAIGVNSLIHLNLKALFMIISIFSVLVFYLTNILIILIKGKIYYDKLFKFEFISTIKLTKED